MAPLCVHQVPTAQSAPPAAAPSPQQTLMPVIDVYVQLGKKDREAQVGTILFRQVCVEDLDNLVIIDETDQIIKLSILVSEQTPVNLLGRDALCRMNLSDLVFPRWSVYRQ